MYVDVYKLAFPASLLLLHTLWLFMFKITIAGECHNLFTNGQMYKPRKKQFCRCHYIDGFCRIIIDNHSPFFSSSAVENRVDIFSGDQKSLT